MQEKLRTLFISDIHQTLNEFQELLKIVQYKKEQDRLILCGDYVDRGNYSTLETIRKIRELDLPSSDILMGNHEKRLIRWYNNNKYFEAPQYEELTPEDMEFIWKMPSYLIVPEHNLWVIHAGLRPNIPIEQQKQQDLLYLRHIDETGKQISYKKILDKTAPANAKFWTELGPWETNIIYGHCVFKDTVRIDKFDNGTSAFGIDGGCVFGGSLNCLIITDDINKAEIVSVKAKQTYYRGWNEQ